MVRVQCLHPVDQSGVQCLHPAVTVVDNPVDSEIPAVGAPVGSLEMRGDDLGIGRRDESEIGESA